MRFDENADLDTSNIDDLRGGGGGGGGGVGGRVALGGGGLGIVGLILYFLLSQLGGGGTGGGGLGVPSGLGGLSDGQTADTSQAASSCRTGAQANTELDCEVVAVVNSLDGYWSDTFARSNINFQPPRTNFFTGGVRTGCGSATSDTGPFYCPGDNEIYIDLSFFRELETRFGAEGGPFARAYVIAHEYGHHIQALLGTNERVRSGETGPTSGTVRLELQADCHVGADGVRTPADHRRHPAGRQRRARHRVPDRRRLHPDPARGWARRPEPVHPRLVRAARALVHDGIPDRRPVTVRHVRAGRQPRLTPVPAR
jgi:hypothetical protein